MFLKIHSQIIIRQTISVLIILIYEVIVQDAASHSIPQTVSWTEETTMCHKLFVEWCSGNSMYNVQSSNFVASIINRFSEYLYYAQGRV